MSTSTAIEWTDATWNPIRGCSRVSEGCRNCYAEVIAGRFSGSGRPFEGLVNLNPVKSKRKWNGKIRFVEEHLLDPLRWKKPRRIFVNSMSDLFHENVTDEMRDKIYAVMALCPGHTFQVLTKRPERMKAYLGSSEVLQRVREAMVGYQAGQMNLKRTGMPVLEWSGMPLNNVWLGVSVENQKTADERIPLLLQTSATVRFISAEPLLGHIELLWEAGWGGPGEPPLTDRVPTDEQIYGPNGVHFIRHGASRLDWVIVGGESGHGARPMHPDWARSLRDQCKSAEVPLFFKQWGEWCPYVATSHGPYENKRFMHYDGRVVGAHEPNPDGMDMRDWDSITKAGKHVAGHLLDGVEYREFPKVKGA